MFYLKIEGGSCICPFIKSVVSTGKLKENQINFFVKKESKY